MYTAVSGMDSSTFQSGRPFGGCGILFRKSLINSITPINTNAKRYCAVSLSGLNNNSILLVNVYLPTDYGTSSSELEFISCLSEIGAFIDSQSYDSDYCW